MSHAATSAGTGLPEAARRIASLQELDRTHLQGGSSTAQTRNARPHPSSAMRHGLPRPSGSTGPASGARPPSRGRIRVRSAGRRREVKRPAAIGFCSRGPLLHHSSPQGLVLPAGQTRGCRGDRHADGIRPAERSIQRFCKPPGLQGGHRQGPGEHPVLRQADQAGAEARAAGSTPSTSTTHLARRRPTRRLAKVPDRHDPRSRSSRRSRCPACSGRGGAGFPTGHQVGDPVPASPADTTSSATPTRATPAPSWTAAVLEGDPHSVIEGMIIGRLSPSASERRATSTCGTSTPWRSQNLTIAPSPGPQDLGLLGEQHPRQRLRLRHPSSAGRAAPSSAASPPP
ncbi:MAG: hypothetical protein MZU95_02270 [Desulfomicrobium escambiense]|nr:hypothetical protein [Desulfomicrobium escambiense]